MKPAKLPDNERERLAALHDYGVLDTLPEQAYDDITQLASCICEAPIALISLVDGERQWFKSHFGLDATETSREVAFCAHALLNQDEIFSVNDARTDSRFADNPLVTGEPNIGFYAGAPLVSGTGHPLGTLCVIDYVPRQLTATQEAALRALSRQVMAQLELSRNVNDLRNSRRELEAANRKLQSNNELLTIQSTTDTLTGLNNRRGFQQHIDKEVSGAMRYSQPLSLIMLDVDHFKSFNDTFGHQAGDQALAEIAAHIKASVRESDTVARYGGEEFAMILPNTDALGAEILAERCLERIEMADWAKRPMTMSAGMTTYTGGNTSSAALISEADQALYHAKDTGRNRAVASGDLSDSCYMRRPIVMGVNQRSD